MLEKLQEHGILITDEWIHPKNWEGLQLSCKEYNIPIIKISSFQEAEQLQSPLILCPGATLERFPLEHIPVNKKIIYGPHGFTFPPHHWIQGHGNPNAVYNALSKWNKDIMNEFGGLRLPIVTIPFAVNIEEYKPVKPIIERSKKCILYFKHRHPNDYLYFDSIVRPYILEKGYQIEEYNYKSPYTDEQLKISCQDAQFAIIIDASESQGFALEQIMSCDVPLLVWDVTTMYQFYGVHLPNAQLKATSIPYWDISCGEVFYNQDNFNSTLELLLSKLTEYKPRDYIIKTLSPKQCMEYLLNEFKE